MITEFDRFEQIATSTGSGRDMRTERRVPVFVPEGGHEAALLDAAIHYLTAQRGFRLLDLRDQPPDRAVAALDLQWPDLQDKWPTDEFEAIPPDGQGRLLIAGGEEPHHVFWRMLAGESLLYAGHSLPPSPGLSPRCIVVPDAASVVAIVAAKDLADYRLEYFGAVGGFNTNQVPFSI